jgi:hypothetical protein
MTPVENRLRAFANFNLEDHEFEDRQRYLRALLKAVSNAAENDEDGWAGSDMDAAADWFDAEVNHYNNQEEITDFKEAEIAAPAPPPPVKPPRVKKIKGKRQKEREAAEALARGYRVYTDLEKDRYGVTMGTKKHEALMLYEKGATPVEVKRKIGGSSRYYNCLREAVANGHHVYRNPNGKRFLVHKDDAKEN